MNDPTPVPIRVGPAFLRAGESLRLDLDAAASKRVRAHIQRIERSEPGLAYPKGEPVERSMEIAVLALLDRALAESEADAGLKYDWLRDRFDRRPREVLRLRVRRAVHALRKGW